MFQVLDKQVKKDFTIHGGLKNGPFLFQFFLQFMCIHQISVMCNPVGFTAMIDNKRLGIDQYRIACRGISYMPDGTALSI